MNQLVQDSIQCVLSTIASYLPRYVLLVKKTCHVLSTSITIHKLHSQLGASCTLKYRRYTAVWRP